MLFLYTLVIRLYYLLICVASRLGHKRAALWYNSRQDSLPFAMPEGWETKNRIWIHSASYGEYEMAKPIVAELLKKENNRIYLSFFSPSGYENLHFDDPRIFKFYLPIDLKSKQRECIDNLQPSKVVFIKYEFWFNFLWLLKNKAIPYYYTSVHINKGSYMLKIPALRNLLQSAAGMYAHNPESINILEQQAFDNLRPFGDTRVNKALENLQEGKAVVEWQDQARTIAYGSLLPSEIPMLKATLTAYPECNHLIAPHDIDDSSIESITSELQANYSLYSEAKGKPIQDKILIINTLGDLKHLYAGCAMAYIGGGFVKGPHSIIEPLAHGVPTVIGPNIGHYPMARHLGSEGFIEVIEEPFQLQNCISQLIKAPRKTPQQIRKKIKSMAVELSPLIEELSA